MKADPIVKEVRKARQELLERHGGDFRRLGDALMRAQHEHEQPVIRHEKQPQAGRAPNAYATREK